MANSSLNIFILVNDYINWRLTQEGCTWEGCPSLPEHDNGRGLFRRLVYKLEQENATEIGEMLASLDLTAETAYPKFLAIANEMFTDSDGVFDEKNLSWGKILAFFAWCGMMAVYCVTEQMPHMIENVCEWILVYCEIGLTEWMWKNNDKMRKLIRDNLGGNTKGLINMNRMRGFARYHPSLYTLFVCVAIKVYKLPESVKGVGVYVKNMLKEYYPFDSILPFEIAKWRSMERYAGFGFYVCSETREVLYHTDLIEADLYDTICLAWFNSRYHYINNAEEFFQSFVCPGCTRGFNDKYWMKIHQDKCLSYQHYVQHGTPPIVKPVKEKVLVGRWKHPFVDPLDHLKKLVGYRTKIKDISSPYMAAFDTETVLLNTDGSIVNDTRNYVFTSCHKLYLIGVCSNIPGFKKVKVFFRYQSDQKEFIKKFVDYLLEMSDKAFKLNTDRFEVLFKDLWTLRDKHDSNGSKQCVAWIESLIRKLLTRLRVLVCITYNGFRYDIPMLKNEGFLSLLQLLDPIKGKRQAISIMKRTKSNSKWKAEAGVKCSLRTLLKDAGFPESDQKSYFPYSYIDSYEKLLNPGLAPYSSFWDDLVGDNLLDREYNDYRAYLAQGYDKTNALKKMRLTEIPETGISKYRNLSALWTAADCRNMMDVAVFYIKQDIKPLLKYALRNRELYLDWANIDLYTDFVSITQFTHMFSQRYIRNNTLQYFVHLPLDIRKELQDSLTGGLSNVFTRLLDPSTGRKIREYEMPDGEKAKCLIGYDCNNLYGREYGGEQFVGPYVDRKEEDDFEPNFLGVHRTMAVEWLEYENSKLPAGEIQHMYNGGENWVHVTGHDDSDPDKITAKRMDGLWEDPDSDVMKAYEFFGHYYHGLCAVHLPGRENELMVGGRTAQQLYDESMLRIRLLEARFHSVEVMWSCEWESKRKRDPDVKSFLERFSFGPDTIKRKMSTTELLDLVQDSKIHGLIQCSVTTPSRLRVPMAQGGHQDMPLIIKHATISPSDIDGYMADYCKKHNFFTKAADQVICSYFADKQWFTTNYIKFVMDHGCEVTRVHRMLQFRFEKVYDDFVESVTRKRVQADIENKPETAKLMKLLINGCYGGTLLNAGKHFNTKLVRGNQMKRTENDPFVYSAEPVGFENPDDYYEVQIKKKNIIHKNLIQLGFNILMNSKIHLMSFYYDFVGLADPKCFELASADTDSIYLILSRNELRDCVPAHNLAEFDRKAVDILVDESDPYSKRQPGRFHEEVRGVKAVFLAPKLYVVVKDEAGNLKHATRGITVSGSNVQLVQFDKFKQVLLDREETRSSVRASGFVQKQQIMCTYIMSKDTLNSVFVKRRVLANAKVKLTPKTAKKIVTYSSDEESD